MHERALFLHPPASRADIEPRSYCKIGMIERSQAWPIQRRQAWPLVCTRREEGAERMPFFDQRASLSQTSTTSADDLLPSPMQPQHFPPLRLADPARTPSRHLWRLDLKSAMALRLLRALALAIGLFLAAGEAETECMGFGCPEEDEGYDDMSILQSFGSGQGSRHLPGQQKVLGSVGGCSVGGRRGFPFHLCARSDLAPLTCRASAAHVQLVCSCAHRLPFALFSCAACVPLVRAAHVPLAWRPRAA